MCGMVCLCGCRTACDWLFCAGCQGMSLRICLIAADLWGLLQHLSAFDVVPAAVNQQQAAYSSMAAGIDGYWSWRLIGTLQC